MIENPTPPLNNDLSELPDYLAHLLVPVPVAATAITSELMTELAYGINDVADICASHGLTPQETSWLLNDDNAAREVDTIRKKLTTSGAMSEMRAEVYLDKVLTEMYELAMRVNAEAQHRVAAAKFIRDVRNDRKPQHEKIQDKFTLTINLSGGMLPPPSIDVACERIPNGN